MYVKFGALFRQEVDYEERKNRDINIVVKLLYLTLRRDSKVMNKYRLFSGIISVADDKTIAICASCTATAQRGGNRVVRPIKIALGVRSDNVPAKNFGQPFSSLNPQSGVGGVLEEKRWTGRVLEFPKTAGPPGGR